MVDVRQIVDWGASRMVLRMKKKKKKKRVAGNNEFRLDK